MKRIPREVWIQVGAGFHGSSTWAPEKTGEGDPEVGPYAHPDIVAELRDRIEKPEKEVKKMSEDAMSTIPGFRLSATTIENLRLAINRACEFVHRELRIAEDDEARQALIEERELFELLDAELLEIWKRQTGASIA